MTYIYDILLNFTDDERLLEFFEWEKEDTIEHIKKIPLIRVSTKQLETLINNQIIIEKNFLDKIEDTTQLYKNSNNIQYATLISDLNKVIAVEFNNKGEVIGKSSLLLDEEEAVIDECLDMKEEYLTYNIKMKKIAHPFLTRAELRKKRYLLKEIENIYKEEKIEKFNYLYEEVFNSDDLSMKEKYCRLKKDIEKNFSEKHKNLYEIIRLTYIKK